MQIAFSSPGRIAPQKTGIGFQRRKAVHRFLGTLGALFTLAATSAFVPARHAERAVRIVTPVVPAQVSSMLETALQAVNQHKRQSLAPFVTGGVDSFLWVDSATHDWKADVLPVPGDAARPPVYLAVFHSFHTCESDGDHVYRLVQPADRTHGDWKLGAEIPETDNLGLHMVDHAAEAVVDKSAKSLTVHDTVTVERSRGVNGRGDLPSFGLMRINEDYRLKSLHVSGSEATAPFEQAGGVIAFVPPSSETFALMLDYSGRPNHNNGDFIHDDEAVLASYWYPHIARLPATLSLTATAPPGWTPIGQGELVSERTNADGSQTMAWRNDIPTSFFTLDMGRYRITNRQWRGRLLSAYILEPKADVAARLARESLDRVQQSLAFFEKSFGPFPYRRFAVVETRGPFNGALEAYSFATFGPRTLPEFVPHELSHTWWGGIIPCPYTRSMWNEAFASYSDDLFRRSGESGRVGAESETAEVNQRLADRKRKVRQYEGAPLAQAFDTEDEAQSSVGYGKGAQVLRVLEDQIGQAAMLASMRAFVSHHTPGETADWTEFETAVERTTGEDLQWFFKQWLNRTGVPRLVLARVTAHAIGNETVIEGTIRQAGEPYRLKVPIAVELRSGGVTRQSIDVRDAETSFTITVPGTPDRLQIDPGTILPLASGAENLPENSDPFTYEFP